VTSQMRQNVKASGPQGRSCFVFTSQNRFRIWVYHTVNTQWFERVVMLMIFLSTVATVLTTLDISDHAAWRLQCFEYLSVAVFATEMCLKITAFGFILDEGSYMRSAFNVCDAVVVLFSILSVIISSSAPWAVSLRNTRGIKYIRFARMRYLLFLRLGLRFTHISGDAFGQLVEEAKSGPGSTVKGINAKVELLFAPHVVQKIMNHLEVADEQEMQRAWRIIGDIYRLTFGSKNSKETTDLKFADKMSSMVFKSLKGTTRSWYVFHATDYQRELLHKLFEIVKDDIKKGGGEKKGGDGRVSPTDDGVPSTPLTPFKWPGLSPAGSGMTPLPARGGGTVTPGLDEQPSPAPLLMTPPQLRPQEHQHL